MNPKDQFNSLCSHREFVANIFILQPRHVLLSEREQRGHRVREHNRTPAFKLFASRLAVPTPIHPQESLDGGGEVGVELRGGDGWSGGGRGRKEVRGGGGERGLIVAGLNGGAERVQRRR
uniref:Uncharacterized protein n=1 Tax=Arundo donax TaxID=35708 RepID=A0A0A9GVA5_ARUDO